MTRLFTTGAETGAAEWNGSNSVPPEALPAARTTYKRTGDYAWYFDTAGNALPCWFRQVFDADETELYGRFALYLDVATVDIILMRFYDSNNAEQFQIRYDVGTSTLGWHTSGGAVIEAGNVLVPVSTWVMVEFYVKCATSGTLTMKINGTTSSSYSGDTDLTNDATLRSMTFGAWGLTGITSIRVYMDDIGINNADGSYQNSWAGLGGVFYLEPTADGDQTDWIPSAGTVNYAMVDDIPPDNATTFNQGYASNEIDLYEVDDCPQYINTINLVEVVYRAALVTSGYNELTDLVKVGGTVYSGTEYTIVPITPSFTYYKGTTHYINPNTGSAWGTPEVNAMQAGIEVTT